MGLDTYAKQCGNGQKPMGRRRGPEVHVRNDVRRWARRLGCANIDILRRPAGVSEHLPLCMSPAFKGLIWRLPSRSHFPACSP